MKTVIYLMGRKGQSLTDLIKDYRGSLGEFKAKSVGGKWELIGEIV